MNCLWWAIPVVLLFPFYLLFCAKLASYGFHRGKRNAEMANKEELLSNGKS